MQSNDSYKDHGSANTHKTADRSGSIIGPFTADATKQNFNYLGLGDKARQQIVNELGESDTRRAVILRDANDRITHVVFGNIAIDETKHLIFQPDSSKPWKNGKEGLGEATVVSTPLRLNSISPYQPFGSEVSKFVKSINNEHIAAAAKTAKDASLQSGESCQSATVPLTPAAAAACSKASAAR